MRLSRIIIWTYRNPNNADNNREVFLATISPAGQVSFTQISQTASGNVSAPSIDGAGDRIAFVSNRAPGPLVSNPGNLREVFYADIAGGAFSLTRATTSTVELGNDQPSISADGTRIGFVSPNIGQVRVYDTLTGAELTSTVGASLNPSMSADGTILVFAHNRQLYLTSYPLASVQVTKTANAMEVFANTPVRYQVSVHNGGPSAASNVIITDSIGIIDRNAVNGGRQLKSISLSPAAGTCYSNQPSITKPITCTLSTLAPNSTVVLTVDITPTAYGTLTNLATADTSTYQRIGTNTSGVTVTVQPLPVAAVNLILSGPPTGTANLPNLFVANVLPITASTPLTYVWQFTNQLISTVSYSSTSFTESQTVTWNPGGVQTVTVSVSNAAHVTVTATRVITIFNPLPVLTNMIPFTATKGDGPLTLNLSGSGFVRTSSVRWNGAPLAAGFVNSTSLTATLPALNLATAGIFSVTVQNGGPGGGTSTPLTFTINNPQPQINNLSPLSAARGGLTTTLLVTGTNFVSGASLYWDGQPPLATLVSPAGTLLTATVPASYLLGSTPIAITVTNPSPSIGPSNAANFALTDPLLTVTVSPTTIGISETAVLTASISDLQAGSRTITLTSSNTNSAVVPVTVTLPAQATSVTVTVQAGSMGDIVTLGGELPANIGGDTDSKLLTVNYRKPTIGPANPASATAGGLTFTLTLSGTDFVNGAQLYGNGTPLIPTNVLNGSSLTVTVPASLIQTPGTRAITVTNPSPSAGPSDPLSFVVVSPTLTLSPNSLSVGLNTTNTITATISAPQAANRTIILTSSSSRIQTPPTVTLPALTDWVTFTVQTTGRGATGIITATLPAAQGGLSGTASIVANNPTPTITNVQPDPVLVGVPVTLTVAGSGFSDATEVRWNSVVLTQTEILANDQLTATVPGALIPVFGDYTLTVSNTAPVSGPGFVTVTVTAENPVPTITSMSPVTRTAGGAGFTLTLTGTNFVNGSSQIYWNGGPLTTVLVNRNLSATITSAMIVQPNEYTVTVKNDTPGGGFATDVLTFTVVTTKPVISAISPITQLVGDPAFTLIVTGTQFVTSTDPARISTVLWNGTELSTTYVSGTKLTAEVEPSLVAPDAGVYTITVANREPSAFGSDQISNGKPYTVSNYLPVLDSISPITATVGDSEAIVTLNGSRFVRNCVAWFKGMAVATGFVNTTQLTATIPGSMLTTAGTFTFTVQSPTPGGGTSLTQTFTVNNRAPHLTDVAPLSRTFPVGSVQVVVTGTYFVNGAQIVWNGSAITPTLFSATRLTATVPSNQIPSPGYYTVTVLNPAPPAGGVLADNFLTVTVNNVQPVLGTPSPATAIAGTGGLTVTIQSTGNTFTTGAIGLVDGVPRNTVLNGQTISVGLTITDIRTVGVRLLTVQNPDPSVAVSAAKNFTVTAVNVNLTPAPTVVITLPTTSAVMTVTITNTQQVESTDITLTSSNPSIASVPATVTLPDHTAAMTFNVTTHNISGTATITATMPASLGGGVSNVVTVRVVDQAITGLSPSNDGAKPRGSPTDFTATIAMGTNVSYTWTFGDASPATTPSSSPAASHAPLAGGYYTATVTAVNSVGTVTATTAYEVDNPTPIATGTTPSVVPVSTTTVITITGSNFVTGAVVQIQLTGTAPITTYTPSLSGPSSLTITIPGTDVAVAGTYQLWVINPEPPAALTPRKSAPITFSVS